MKNEKLRNIARKLVELKPELSKRFGLKKIGVFGSYIHELENSQSDLDILVSFSKPPGLTTFLEFENFLTIP